MPPSRPPFSTASPCTRSGSTSMARVIASTSLTSAPRAAAASGLSVRRAPTPTEADMPTGADRRPTHRTPPRPDRIRRIDGGFAFVPNEFLHRGFFASLSDTERSLYFFFLLAGDRNGVSFYAHDRICAALELTLDDYLVVRDSLID